jgi:hypothetical protein
VLNITSQIMDQILGDERVTRGFRVKFPEDVLQDNLAGQLWFGAEVIIKDVMCVPPPCFGRHVKPLVPAAFLVVCTHSNFKKG